MEIPRYKIGKEFNSFFGQFVPTMIHDEKGDFVKYHELERVQKELEKCYSEIAEAIQDIGDNQKVFYILNELIRSK